MKPRKSDLQKLDNLIKELSRLGNTQTEKELVSHTLSALDEKHGLSQKMEREPGVEEIIKQLLGRIFRSYRGFSPLKNKRILDIACGSNTSKAPPEVFVKSLSGERKNLVSDSDDATALFEPWFCRMLLEFDAHPVGIDLGNLEGERFEYYQVDLGEPGALDFLPDHSYDAVQDSRLFGSPEFTAQFPNQADHLKVAAEIWRQEQRLLKPNGIVIHSDAARLLR